jgi:hypothetical protein
VACAKAKPAKHDARHVDQAHAFGVEAIAMYHVLGSVGGHVRRFDLPKKRGAKYYPHDVERYACEGFSPGAMDGALEPSRRQCLSEAI